MIYLQNKDDKRILEFFKDLRDTKSNVISLDTETNSLKEREAKLILLQIGIEDRIYIFNALSLPRDIIKLVVQKIIDVDRKVIMHNAKFDTKILKAQFDLLITNVFDTMYAEVLLNAGVGEKLYSLAYVVEKYCGEILDKELREEFIQENPDPNIPEHLIQYSALDVKYLQEVYEEQMKLLEENKELRIQKIEEDFIAPSAMMEYYGIGMDKALWAKAADKAIALAEEYRRDFIAYCFDKLDYSKYNNGMELAEDLCIPVKLKRDQKVVVEIKKVELLKEWAKENFNMNSTKQMPALLNAVGIKISGSSAKAINKLNKKHEATELLLKYREQAKLASTYGYNILEMISPITNRLHTDYNNIISTGRISSMKPNLQNIPATNEYRNPFIPQEGWSFINPDYSQMELRLTGAVSGETKMIYAYKNSADIHKLTASLLFHKNIDEVTKEERGTGKTLNFAILYGTSEFGLKKNLGISVDEARSLIDGFFAGYPKLSAFKEMAEEQMLKLGYSITPLGRRRYIQPKPLFTDAYGLKNWRAKQLREGFNHIIQGGSADIVKLAINNIFYKNPFGELLRILHQVHDEILVEARDDIAKDASEFIKYEMESVEQKFLGEIPALVDGIEPVKCWSK